MRGTLTTVDQGHLLAWWMVCSKSLTEEEQSDSSVQWCHRDRVWNRSRLERPSLSQMLTFITNFSLDGTQSELDLEARHYILTDRLSLSQDRGRPRSVWIPPRFPTCCLVFGNIYFCLFHVLCCIHMVSFMSFSGRPLLCLEHPGWKWPSATSSTNTCGFTFWIMRNCKTDQ